MAKVVDFFYHKAYKQPGPTVEYLGGRCQHCGLEDDCVNIYDFHHTNPVKKDFEISGGKVRSSFESIKKELDKCELLCSNCHRKEHGCCKRQI